ncbi:MAG TPA: hypothetical protein VIM37_02545 [Candidatus Microsaccharimonas sp.]|jgi:hypothetical protein
MNVFKKLVATFIFAVFIAAPVMTAVVTPTTYAADQSSCEVRILGIPPWYQGLTSRDASGACSIDAPKEGKLPDFIWHIALNVIEIALYLVGYIAIFFILYGGFQFLTGGSNASQIEKARKTILNAVVGLVISIGAVVIVNLIFGILG